MEAAMHEPGGGPQAGMPLGKPFDLSDAAAYENWRSWKLEVAAAARNVNFIPIGDPARLTSAEREAILQACSKTNMAFYACPGLEGDEESSRHAIASMIKSLGLRHFEEHRSASGDGIVPIEVTDTGGRAGFIPYSNRAINWHTDGYYSYESPRRMIRSMVLHCVRDAQEGGENGFFDPDIAYIRLRDENPAFVEALQHPQAMTIPAFDDAQGKSHSAVSGPVFVVENGRLAMRFTIRKRNIVWRDDPVLADAVAFLGSVLAADPLQIHARLSPNQGIICNNVLHDRKAFSNKEGGEAGRLLFRVRSYDRIGTI